MQLRNVIPAAVAAMFVVSWASYGWAQAAPPAPASPPGPPKGLSGSAGFGLSLTSGNTDTITLNATVDSIYDPKTNNVMKWNALFLRGKQNGLLTVNRVSAMFRDENSLSPRMYVFGQIDTLHDTFKQIDYLIAPAAGVGFKALNTVRTQLAADVGAGAVIEQDAGVVARGAVAATLSQKLVHQLSDTTTLRESAAALLKTNDWADGLYTFQIGISSKLAGRFQIAVDVLDTFKNRPNDPTLKKNDVALVTSLVAKY